MWFYNFYHYQHTDQWKNRKGINIINILGYYKINILDQWHKDNFFSVLPFAPSYKLDSLGTVLKYLSPVLTWHSCIVFCKHSKSLLIPLRLNSLVWMYFLLVFHSIFTYVPNGHFLRCMAAYYRLLEVAKCFTYH